MPLVEFAHRNVIVYDQTVNPPVVVAGCTQWGNMTCTDFFLCLSFCFETPFPGQFWLADRDGNIFTPTQTTFPTGEYSVIGPGSCQFRSHMLMKTGFPLTYIEVELTTEAPRLRTISAADEGTPGVSSHSFLAKFCQTENFTRRVRARDRVCQITGTDLSFAKNIGQKACHIVPPSHISHVRQSILSLIIL